MKRAFLVLACVMLTACSAARATPPPPIDDFPAQITAAHNAIRRGVRPAPRTPLPVLVWDASLERLAREWANTCPSGHRPRNRFGENIYWSGGMPATAASAVQAWARESAYYDYESTVCTKDGQQSWSHCGHYTQMVWRGTARLGCAVKTNCRGRLSNVIVCNYDPPGNVDVSDTSIPHPY